MRNSARQPSALAATDTSHTASHPSSELLSLNQYVSCFTPAGLTANSNALRLSWNESIITRIQSDGDRFVAPGSVTDDFRRLGVHRRDGDIERRRVVRDPRFGLIRGGCAVGRVALQESRDGGRLLPGRFGELPVDSDRLSRPRGGGAVTLAAGALALREPGAPPER